MPPSSRYAVDRIKAAALVLSMPSAFRFRRGADVRTRTFEAPRGSYRAVLQASIVGGERYVDKGWRE